MCGHPTQANHAHRCFISRGRENHAFAAEGDSRGEVEQEDVYSAAGHTCSQLGFRF